MEILEFTRQFGESIENIGPDSLSPDTNFREEIEQWDSLSVLTVIAMIDSEYDTAISAEELKNCLTIKDVFSLVKTRKEK